LELHFFDRFLHLNGNLGVFFVGMVHAFARKQAAADNPWGAGATTLEWTLSSPPPFHQYDSLPLIR